MFRRMPYATCRSNCNAGLTSKKWKWEPTWIGRSPLLATVTVAVVRPTFNSMSPGSISISPGIMLAPSSGNRVVHGDELRAVGEGGFDLDFRDHFGDAFHHIG